MLRSQLRCKSLLAVASLLAALVIPLVAAGPAHAFVIRHVADLPAGSRVAVADDFNGDHETDLAVASDCAIHVLLGHGDGTFDAPAALAVGTAACGNLRPWLTTGDVDNDGASDLILTRGDEPKVWVFRGHGGGTFAVPVSYPTATGEPALGVAAADLNGDDRDDIIIVERTQALFFPIDLAVLLANSTGGFDPGVRYGQSFRTAENLTVGHVDSDTNVDVAVGAQRCDAAFTCQNGVIEFAGNGNGTIGTPVVVDGIAQTAGQFVQTADGMPTALLAAPLRGLTRDDLIVTTAGVQTLLPAADGTLTAQPPASSASGWGDVGDVDRDGAFDVAVVGGRLATVLLGTGAGDFDVEGQIEFPSFLDSVQIADVDDDGWPDFTVASEGGRVDALLNTPTGGLDPNALDFGSTPPGTPTSAQTITVFNGGVRPLHVTGLALSGPHASEFSVTGDLCTGHALAVLDSCNVSVAFTPAAAGPRSGSLLVSSDDPTGPLEAALVGAGISAGAPVAPAATTPPATTLTPDRTPPSIKLNFPAQQLNDALRRGLIVRVSCSEACTVLVKLVLSRRAARALDLSSPPSGLIVGQRRVSVKRAGGLRFAVRFTRRLREAAKRVKRLELRVTGAAVDLAGNRAPPLQLAVRLKRSRSR